MWRNQRHGLRALKKKPKPDRPPKIQVPRPDWQVACSAKGSDDEPVLINNALARPKQQKLEDAEWLEAVREVPFCVACGRVCRPQAAHRNEDKALSEKNDDIFCAALCADCHYELDNGMSYTREQRRELHREYLDKTWRIMRQMGLIRAYKKGKE